MAQVLLSCGMISCDKKAAEGTPRPSLKWVCNPLKWV